MQITSPTSGATVLKSTKVYVTASDNAGVTRVDLLVDGKLYSTSSSSTPVFSWNTMKVARGSHTLQAVAYDAAGNQVRALMQGGSGSQRFRYDAANRLRQVANTYQGSAGNPIASFTYVLDAVG